MSSNTRSSIWCLFVRILLSRMGSEMIWLIVFLGSSEEYGSWKMICISLRMCRISAFRELGNILSFKEHLAGGRLNETKNGPARRGLAAAGLADQPQCLAALQVEADVVDRVQHTVTGLEVFFQVTDL